MGDLLDPEYFRERLGAALDIKNRELEMLGLRTFDADEVFEQYMKLAERLAPMICDTSELVNGALRTDGERVLFEGAQGMMLCIDHGTYPYVTSSSPSAASVPVGAGIAPQWIRKVVGVAKAYCTRVGSGPFPTELHDATGDGIRERGHEYGTVTGRPRRIGWFDAVVGRYTAQLGGITDWAIMLPRRANRRGYNPDMHRLRTRRAPDQKIPDHRGARTLQAGVYRNARMAGRHHRMPYIRGTLRRTPGNTWKKTRRTHRSADRNDFRRSRPQADNYRR